MIAAAQCAETSSCPIRMDIVKAPQTFIVKFCTPAMIALMEKTAWTSVSDELDEGCGTVGISLNVAHSAPTPLGMKVTCESELTGIDGRKLTFYVKAYDEKGVIGEGTHERFIIQNEKFQKKANMKKDS